MGQIHPEFAGFCENMNGRMYDLMEIFKKQWYADPKFKGSYSIKKVLPVLVPELSYKDLEINEGASAMSRWKEIVCGELSNEEVEHVRECLLRYCELDTRAMVEIYMKVCEVIK